MIFKRFAKIFVGCLVIVIILIILGVVFAGTIARKVISGVISQKTGVNVNVNDINKGNLTYTDPKTGTTLNVGTNKIPDNFPKDFPIYPGATVTTSLSGNSSSSGSDSLAVPQGGMWVTFTTKDDESKVISYYKTNLTDYGWNNTETEGSTTGWAISKGSLDGYLTIQSVSGQTSIVVTLTQEK